MERPRKWAGPTYEAKLDGWVATRQPFGPRGRERIEFHKEGVICKDIPKLFAATGVPADKYPLKKRRYDDDEDVDDGGDEDYKAEPRQRKQRQSSSRRVQPPGPGASPAPVQTQYTPRATLKRAPENVGRLPPRPLSLPSGSGRPAIKVEHGSAPSMRLVATPPQATSAPQARAQAALVEAAAAGPSSLLQAAAASQGRAQVAVDAPAGGSPLPVPRASHLTAPAAAQAAQAAQAAVAGASMPAGPSSRLAVARPHQLQQGQPRPLGQPRPQQDQSQQKDQSQQAGASIPTVDSVDKLLALLAKMMPGMSKQDKKRVMLAAVNGGMA